MAFSYFAPPARKFVISHEPTDIAGEEDPHPFILCCETSEFFDLDKRSDLFEQQDIEAGQDTYILTLPSWASEEEISACEAAIKNDLKCALHVLPHFNRYKAELQAQQSNNRPGTI